MLTLGIDLGTSFVKVCIYDAEKSTVITSIQYPNKEMQIISKKQGLAEQSPELWWESSVCAIKKAHRSKLYHPQDIQAIGIAYQMLGLEIVNKKQKVLRNSIIWCDSRASSYGTKAFDAIGSEYCTHSLLNSPGNFISMRLTGLASTTVSVLSEAVIYDFKKNKISSELLHYFDFDESLFPVIKEVFSNHGNLDDTIAESLHLQPGIPVTYMAGDQLNNALALDVFEQGGVAATGGTSGVIYGISNTPTVDKSTRFNSFAHVNHSEKDPHYGVLLCIKGAGIINKWIRDINRGSNSYEERYREIEDISPGSEGLRFFTVGNRAERMCKNKTPLGGNQNPGYSRQTEAHIYRVGQEAIAYLFRYGLDILRENGIYPSIVKAGNSNFFLSDVFTGTLASATSTTLEIFEPEGSRGAVIGAAIGAGVYENEKEVFSKSKPLKTIYSLHSKQMAELYNDWKYDLENLFFKVK